MGGSLNGGVRDAPVASVAWKGELVTVCCQSNPMTLQALAADISEVGASAVDGEKVASMAVGRPVLLLLPPANGNTVDALAGHVPPMGERLQERV